jgi:hypothetical protein
LAEHSPELSPSKDRTGTAGTHLVAEKRASSHRVGLDFRVSGSRGWRRMGSRSRLELGDGRRETGSLLPAVLTARPALSCDHNNASSPALGSRPESCDRTSLSAVPSALRPTTSTNALPWSFSALRRMRSRSSDLRRACLTRLCGVLRLSQPLDASFRSSPSGLVSCR